MQVNCFLLGQPIFCRKRNYEHKKGKKNKINMSFLFLFLELNWKFYAIGTLKSRTTLGRRGEGGLVTWSFFLTFARGTEYDLCTALKSNNFPMLDVHFREQEHLNKFSSPTLNKWKMNIIVTSSQLIINKYLFYLFPNTVTLWSK